MSHAKSLKKLKKKQKQLKESLTQLKWSYRAVQFGRILKKAQRYKKNLKDAKNPKSIKLVKDLFNIMQSKSKGASDFIAHIMWEALNENIKEVLPYAFKADIADMIKPYEKNKLDESEVNIELLLNRIKHIVSSSTLSKPGWSTLNYYILCLTKQCYIKVNECLSVIYENRMKLNFAKKEKLQIGELISEAIYPIKLYIRRLCLSFDVDMYHSVLQKKAAMQFLISEYGKFPTSSKSVAQVLDDSNIKDYMKVFDILIDRSFEFQDLFNGTYD